VAGLVYLAEVPRVSVVELRARIKRDLPLGTERGKVEAWLRQRGLSFSDISEVTTGKRVGLTGTIANVYRVELLSKTDIEFEFYFDGEDKLISFSVEEDSYGL
jgi:hypothetical protein